MFKKEKEYIRRQNIFLKIIGQYFVRSFLQHLERIEDIKKTARYRIF